MSTGAAPVSKKKRRSATTGLVTLSLSCEHFILETSEKQSIFLDLLCLYPKKCAGFYCCYLEILSR
jgi:hypothetical protein